MPHKIIEHPVPLIYKKILKNKSSGELIIKSDSFVKNLFFLRGTLVFSKTNLIQERIGEILFKLGKIDNLQFLNLKQMMSESTEKLGKILIQKNILNQKDLYFALLYQVRIIAISVFDLTTGEWEFLEQIPNLDEDSKFNIELPDIIHEGIKNIKNISFYKNKFENLVPKLLPLTAPIKEFLLSAHIEFYQELKKYSRHNHEQIISELNMNEEIYWKKIILFYLFDIIDFTAISTDINLNENIEQLLELYEKLKFKNIDYYELLGVKNSAQESEIKQAYFEMAKKFHPDRTTEAPDPEIKEKANFVFSMINRAYDTLVDEDKKKYYDKQGYKEADQNNRIKENLLEKARILYRKAKTLYNQQKYWEASALLNEAVKLDHYKSSYFLLLGLSQLNIESLKRTAEKSLQKAIDLDPWSCEPYVALGMLFLSENFLKRSEGFFRKAISLNPDHAVAREKLKEIQRNSKKKKPLFKIFEKKKTENN